MRSQGFLTVRNNFEILKNLHQSEPAIICKDINCVVAYILAMTVDSEQELPFLKSIFQKFKEVCYEEKQISI